MRVGFGEALNTVVAVLGNRRRLILLSLMLLSVPTLALAEEVAVSYEIVDVQLDDPLVLRAIINVTVVNSSGQDLNNVDLRPDGAFSVAEGVVQFGLLPADEARTESCDALISAESYAADTQLFWSVDFDDPAGAHQTTYVASPELGQ